MTTYVAFLRGIGPLNPNMRNPKLRSVFESLGFANVRAVMSTGNIIFDANSADVPKLESDIEAAIERQLQFHSTTIIRSASHLQHLLGMEPFKGFEHSAGTSLNVTFLKQQPVTDLKFPHQPTGKSFTILALYDRDITSVTDLSGSRTPDLMLWLERTFGKDITTRTPNTLASIVKQLAP